MCLLLIAWPRANSETLKEGHPSELIAVCALLVSEQADSDMLQRAGQCLSYKGCFQDGHSS